VCSSDLRFLIPEGGVSAIDRPGQPFHDPDADRALFDRSEERRVGKECRSRGSPDH